MTTFQNQLHLRKMTLKKNYLFQQPQVASPFRYPHLLCNNLLLKISPGKRESPMDRRILSTKAEDAPPSTIEELTINPGQERTIKVWYCPKRQYDEDIRVCGLFCRNVDLIRTANSTKESLIFH